jgi:hypothetical protein
MARKLQATAALTIGLIALGGSAVPAAAADRAELKVGFGTGAPASATSISIDIVYRHPDDPNRKPPELTGGVFHTPAGTRFDNSALPKCAASNAEIQARGPAACPNDTKVGSGKLVAMTGFGPPADPANGDLTVFNGDKEFIEVVTAPGTDRVLGIDRVTISGSTLTAHPPSTPGGPPDGKTAIREIHLKIGRGGFVTTPPSCPASARWSYDGAFTFGDGGSARPAGTTPCSLPALKLEVGPSRVRAGTTRLMYFSVTSAAKPDCARGATVRFAGRRVTTDRMGHAHMRVRFVRVKSHNVRVSKAGCAPARAKVTAVR